MNKIRDERCGIVSRFVSEQHSYAFFESIGSFFVSIFIVFSCLIRFFSSNIYYIDDMTRTVSGSGWDIVGRPLSSLTMQVLSGGRFVQDLSPLTQVLGVIFVTLAAYLLSLSFLKGGEINLLRILFILVIALNPYMLEIYAYKYDSLPYPMGVFFAALAYLVLFDHFLVSCVRQGLSDAITLAVSALLLCVATLFYQPAITVFLAAGSFRLCVLGITESLSIKHLKLTASFLLTVFASLATAKFAKDILLNQGDWAVGQSQFTLSQAHINLYSNTLKAWGFFVNDWFATLNSLSLFVTLILCNVVLMVLTYTYKTTKGRGLSGRQFGQYLFSALCFMAGSSLGLFGLSALLDNPHTKPRTFLSLGVTLAILLILPYSLGLCRNQYSRRLLVMIGSIGAFSVITFAVIWGNAMAAQNVYQNAIIWQLAQDIYSFEKDEAKVEFENSVGFSPLISKTTLEQYPLLKRLLARHPSRNWDHGYIGMRVKTGLSLTSTEGCSRDNLPMLVDRLSYSIRDCDSRLLVSFK